MPTCGTCAWRIEVQTTIPVGEEQEIDGKPKMRTVDAFENFCRRSGIWGGGQVNEGTSQVFLDTPACPAYVPIEKKDEPLETPKPGTMIT